MGTCPKCQNPCGIAINNGKDQGRIKHFISAFGEHVIVEVAVMSYAGLSNKKIVESYLVASASYISFVVMALPEKKIL